MSDAARPTSPTPTRCARCGATFGCGAQLERCWCQQLPPLDPARLAGDIGCYCPDCLAALVAEQQQATRG